MQNIHTLSRRLWCIVTVSWWCLWTEHCCCPFKMVRALFSRHFHMIRATTLSISTSGSFYYYMVHTASSLSLSALPLFLFIFPLTNNHQRAGEPTVGGLRHFCSIYQLINYARSSRYAVKKIYNSDLRTVKRS